MIFKKLAKDEKGILPFILGCVGGILVIGSIALVLIVMGFGFGGGESGGGGSSGGWTGSDDTTATLDGLTLPTTDGKLGSEEHVPGRVNIDFRSATDLSCMVNLSQHYENVVESAPLTYPDTGNCASYNPHATDQERWYFNMRWPSSEFAHKKIVITNPENKKRIVASIEEYGPAEFVTERDGVNSGASPEVRNYLGIENPYTGNPNDKKGYVVFGFAKDQNIPLGPLQ